MNSFATVKGFSPVDLLLALALGGSLVAFLNQIPQLDNSAEILFLIAISLIVVGTFLRRTDPLPAAAAVYLGSLLRFVLLPEQIMVTDVAPLFALYAVLVYGPKAARIPAISVAVLGAGLIVLPVLTFVPARSTFALAVVASQGAVAAVTIGGLYRRQQFQAFAAVLEEAQLAQANAEKEAELVLVGERARIAREMHDIVAHTLTVVIAQADGGRYAAKNDPEAAARALETISEMSRAALGDIRSIIGVLRDKDDTSAPLAPEPIDSDLKPLIEKVRESGHAVSYVVIGQARPLPVGVGNALYRICQEALTNSLKYAGPEAELTVTLDWRESEVILEILDNGRGAAVISDGKGHGIIGMRERAALFGGTVSAGPRSAGGYRVTAKIPLALERNSLE